MKQSREWQRMLSGRRLDLFDPSPVDIEIEDIARGLAFVARWNGQTDGDHPYSVAQHSLLVEEIFNILVPDVAPVWKLAALLHDAAEYVVGDMVSPVKGAVGPQYSELEARLMTAVHIRFGIPDQPPPNIGRAIKKARQGGGPSGSDPDRAVHRCRSESVFRPTGQNYCRWHRSAAKTARSCSQRIRGAHESASEENGLGEFSIASGALHAMPASSM